MNTVIPSSSIQNVYSPIQVGGKWAGNLGGIAEMGNGGLFRGMFDEALRNVENLDAEKTDATYNLAAGNIDDLTALITDAERAQIAFQLLVQMRNKVLDSYTEIMRMNI